jgi:hypothetical protein
LYENYGQLFDNIHDFKAHYFKIAAEPFTAMLYDNTIEELENNYFSFKAPDMSKVQVKLDLTGKIDAPVKEENPIDNDPSLDRATISAFFSMFMN